MPPCCSTRLRSAALSGRWSAESRCAEPFFLPSTQRLSPTLATKSRRRPSSSGPARQAKQHVLPEVAQVRPAPPSNLLAYLKK